jgi:hypothetical protein
MLAETVPAPQERQAGARGVGWYLPAGHKVQFVNPAPEKLPSLHAEQAKWVVAPTTPEALPGAQFVQVANPSEGANLPAGHLRQVSEEVAAVTFE